MKTRLIVFIGLPLVSLSLALLAGSALAWRFLLFFIVVLAVSWLWARLSLRSITGQAELATAACRVGEGVEESFAVENTGRIPLPAVEVVESTTLPGYRNDRSFSLPAGSTRQWQAVIPCNRRGSYQVGGLEITVADPLGLFPVKKRFGDTSDIIVYPAWVELPFFQVVPRLQPGLSPRRWMASETGAGASRVREYTSGDSLRHIHWPSTAHSGRLMVKEFDQERSNYSYRAVWIIGDMHEDAHHRYRDASTEETTVTIMASLARKYLENGKEVGLTVAADHIYRHEPDHTPQHEEDIFRSLALMKASGRVPLAQLVSEEAENVDTGSAVVIVMPSEGQDITASLRRIVTRGALVAVILLDSSTYGGWMFAGPVARSLAANGLNVYIVRCGDDIATVLDSRLLVERGHSGGATAG